jgi:hypothetical protein
MQMIRNLKVFGLAVVALVAMTAVAASAASAAEFHAENEPVIYEGSQVTQHVFKVTTGLVRCNVATFKGTNSSKTTTTTTLEPTYTGCTAFGVKATVAVNGCKYVFHSEAGETSPYPVKADVECPAGKKIVVTPVGIACIVEVGNQTGLTGITLTNVGAGTTREINAGIAVVSQIKYDEVGLECVGKAGETTGTYEGTANIKGYNDAAGVKGEQQGIWMA